MKIDSWRGVVDFHVHVTPPEIISNWEKLVEKEPYFAMLSKNPHNKYATADDVVSTLETNGFEKAVIFGFAFLDPGLCRLVNDYVIEKVKNYPEKLIGFMSVSPCADGLENEIERCYKAGLRGIGEIFPEGQGINIEIEKEMRTLTEACKALDIPVMLHVNEPVGHYYIGKNDIPLQKVERFIENSWGCKVILAHWGGGLFFYEVMPKLREKFCNVFYDTAATPFLYDPQIYSAAKALGLCEKILFGSDFPLLPQSRYLPALEQSSLSTEEIQLILGGNAKKLLNF
jgi:predicted TIM-barrel fold metal-dependent hydrolase